MKLGYDCVQWRALLLAVSKLLGLAAAGKETTARRYDSDGRTEDDV